MLARFAAALQRGQIQAVAGQGFGGGGGTIVVNDNDNCSVSSILRCTTAYLLLYSVHEQSACPTFNGLAIPVETGPAGLITSVPVPSGGLVLAAAD